MAHASEPVGTIDPKAAAHFGKMAAEWWDPSGSSALLHQMNPVRLGYIRDQNAHHWQPDAHDRKPLAGRRAVDLGSGAAIGNASCWERGCQYVYVLGVAGSIKKKPICKRKVK